MIRCFLIASLVMGLALACGAETGPTSTSTPTTVPATGLGSPVTPQDSFQPASPTPLDAAPVPTSTPVSTSTPESTPSLAGSVGPTPPPPSSPGALVLTEAELRGLVHPGLQAAIEDLLWFVGEDLGPVEILRLDAVTWRDTSLGCPEPEMFYAQVLTPGLWLVLVHLGQEHDYRVEGERAVRCVQGNTSEPLDRQPLPGIWTRLAGLPTPRSEVAAAELIGNIYVFGGFGAGATANEEYDIATGSWQSRAPIPRGVDHPAAVAIGGKLYLMGGFDGRWGPVADVWAYDPQEDTWTQKADLPTPRGALGAAVVEGKIYAIGGVGQAGYVGTTEVYDPATDAWTGRSPIPTARDHIAVAASQGKIYVAGGRLGSFSRNLDANQAYDPDTDSWAELAPLPTARSGNTAAILGSRVFVLGGEATDGTFDTNEAYDPNTNTWAAMPPMPTARHGLGAVALNSRVYVLAGGPEVGGSRSSLNEVFIFLPGTAP